MLWWLVRTKLYPHRQSISLIIVFQVISVLCNLWLPSLNAAIIDDGLVRGDEGAIWSKGGFMLVVSVVQIAAQITATYFAARTGAAFGRDTRAGLFHAVGTFSQREVNKFGAASLITRTTNDVQQVQLVIMMALTMAISTPIMAVGGIVAALNEDVQMSWLLAVAVPILGVLMGFLITRLVPGFRALQGFLDVVNRILREQLSGIRTVRAFVREDTEVAKFGAANHDLTTTGVRVMRLMSLMFPVVMMIMNLSTVAVWWFGAHRINDGTMQIGSLTAYMNYLMQILMSVMMATFVVMMIPRASVSGDRIGEVLLTEPSVRPSDTPSDIESISGAIEFDDVEFSYPGADSPVLAGLSFTVSPGETLAVIGSTGSGKSTLVSLIARLFDVTGGAVRIDGHNVRDLPADALWGHVGIVPQRAFLFTGTVATNLRYGRPDASDEELWDALTIAQAADFVRELGGLDAPIAQGGTNVSGGQRQRLCIARALVTQAPIYLFDDSFSALDLATDAALRAALAPRVRAASVIIVGQRVSTIEHADRILVLDAGRIVGLAPHDELLRTCETYREIAESQRRVEASA
ncbi:ABC transporter ATP-binding protein [Jongsikchunia kroppenstedtii]|uniref:ABC transporter ATP-binding protein n=1 Tax=Jongsikchunia kroppenstedtii TaxID=1121721 RepID=UPI0003678370|nr:ABC transporter ATP-binding protein [Jongsikchunia kroppenstedtii]